MKRIKRKQPKNLTTRDLISAAAAHHQRGQLEKAEVLYRRVLELSPNDASGLHFYGVLLHQRGRSAEAIDSIQRAIQLDPKYVDAHNNLGNVFKELGRLREAAAAYRQVLALDQDNAGAHNNLGAALRRLEQFSDSIIEYQRALELDPNNADIWLNLGNSLRASDRVDEALTAFRKAIEIRPMHGEANLGLGRALHSLGRGDEATIVYRKWLERYPDNPVARHMLAAATGIDVPARASDEYVEKHFDGFAADFDDKLGRLGYRAPKLIAHALEVELGSSAARCNILDAGCGTGLCGALIRDHAQRLVGVDLSQRMLDKAQGLGIYDELIRAELTGFMIGRAGSFDAVIAADVLVYFGALEQVFEAAATALRPDGCLIFSVEDAGDHDRGLRLNANGRYSHTSEYLEHTLANAGLSVSRIDSEVLRRELGSEVAGLLVTARKRC